MFAVATMLPLVFPRCAYTLEGVDLLPSFRAPDRTRSPFDAWIRSRPLTPTDSVTFTL